MTVVRRPCASVFIDKYLTGNLVVGKNDLIDPCAENTRAFCPLRRFPSNRAAGKPVRISYPRRYNRPTVFACWLSFPVSPAYLLPYLHPSGVHRSPIRKRIPMNLTGRIRQIPYRLNRRQRLDSNRRFRSKRRRHTSHLFSEQEQSESTHRFPITG